MNKEPMYGFTALSDVWLSLPALYVVIGYRRERLISTCPAAQHFITGSPDVTAAISAKPIFYPRFVVAHFYSDDLKNVGRLLDQPNLHFIVLERFHQTFFFLKYF